MEPLREEQYGQRPNEDDERIDIWAQAECRPLPEAGRYFFKVDVSNVSRPVYDLLPPQAT